MDTVVHILLVHEWLSLTGEAARYAWFCGAVEACLHWLEVTISHTPPQLIIGAVRGESGLNLEPIYYKAESLTTTSISVQIAKLTVPSFY